MQLAAITQAGQGQQYGPSANYENTATFETSTRQSKEVLHAFFVEEGLINGK